MNMWPSTEVSGTPRGLGPPFLKAQATAHAGEPAEHRAVFVEQIGYAFQVAHSIEPVLETVLRSR